MEVERENAVWAGDAAGSCGDAEVLCQAGDLDRQGRHDPDASRISGSIGSLVRPGAAGLLRWATAPLAWRGIGRCRQPGACDGLGSRQCEGTAPFISVGPAIDVCRVRTGKGKPFHGICPGVSSLAWWCSLSLRRRREVGFGARHGTRPGQTVRQLVAWPRQAVQHADGFAGYPELSRPAVIVLVEASGPAR